jgi:membrane protein
MQKARRWGIIGGMTLRLYFSLLKDTVAPWSAHKAQWLGAALAYYTVFSLAPLLIILIAIVGFVYGPAAAQARLIGQLQAVVGPESASLVGSMVTSAYRSNSDVIATLIGVGTLVFGALGVFGQLQAAINTIWDVKPSKVFAVRRLLRDRLVSLGMVLGTGFLLLLSLVASTALVAVSGYVGTLLPAPAIVLAGANLAFWLAVSTLLFGVLFKFLPDAPVGWSDVWHGAALTSLLFTAGRVAIAWYLGAGTITTVYGTAGSLAVLLVWIYYSAQILLFGAEFTHVYAMRARTPAGVAAERRAADPERKDPFHERIG